MDGFIKGIWEYKTQKSTTSVKVNLFSAIPENIKEGIASQAEQIGHFLDTRVELEFSES